MDKKVEKIAAAKTETALKRVAAYARVSSGKDAMRHSLSAQVSYYSSMIQGHPGWTYAGVYSDEAKTGTKENREDFQRLLDDCEAGKIDMIITKSVSRFARNTVLLLETVRRLKTIGVDVYFEEQNLHTTSVEGEFILTIIASVAQEESRSVSENQKWRVRQCFSEGRPWNMNMLGYRQKDGVLHIVPEEAEIVRRIFSEYLSGSGTVKISNGLNADGIPSYNGGEWGQGYIWKILRGYAYTGNLELQRYYRENHITKRYIKNNGELQKYIVTDSHEPIIDIETFNAVQREIDRRANKVGTRKREYPYSHKIVCDKCGKKYRRKTTSSGHVWICDTYNTKGKIACPSTRIPESSLDEVFAGIDLDSIETITACDNNILKVKFSDGSEYKYVWKDRDRRDSWTPEMRERARKKYIERMMSDG